MAPPPLATRPGHRFLGSRAPRRRLAGRHARAGPCRSYGLPPQGSEERAGGLGGPQYPDMLRARRSRSRRRSLPPSRASNLPGKAARAKNGPVVFSTSFHADELLPNRSRLYDLGSVRSNLEALVRACHDADTPVEFVQARRIPALFTPWSSAS